MKKRILTLLTAGLLYVIFVVAFSFIDSKVNAAEMVDIKSTSYDTARGIDPGPLPPPPPKR